MFRLTSPVRATSRSRRALGTREAFAPIWERPASRRPRTRYVHPVLRLVETPEAAPRRRAA